MTDIDRLTAALAGRYTIEREIGRGGMATVYLAHDVRHDRKVAIKVLRPDLAASLGSERFLREIHIAAKLTHPHILPLHDSGEADGFLYFVMPFIEGDTLRDRLSREGELPVEEVVRLLRELADAIALAHRQGIVHRDLKPDNVLLSEGHALVTDFGVAKAVTEAAAGHQITSFGMAVGTPAYMSPEQASGDPNIDHRADIYALGAMAYEMLTRRPPFEGDTPQTVLAAHVTQSPRAVNELRSTVPSELAAVVMRCLEKNPADRWQSAADLRTQLEVFVTGSGPVTPFSTLITGAMPADALRRNEPARVLALFAVTAVVAIAVVYGLTLALGLPNWVVTTTLVLLAAGLPFVVLTARAERQRARARLGAGAPPDQGFRSWLTWRRALTGGGMVFSAFAGVVTIYMAMRLVGIGPVGTLVASGLLEKRERIVLADFVNLTADSTLGGTVTELLRIDLAQSPTVTVLEPVQVGRVLSRMQRSPDEPLTDQLAAEVAAREGLKGLVSGEIRPVGAGFVVASRLTAANTGDLLWAGRESARDAAGLIDAVDRLSASLRARIGESLKTIRADAPLAQVTTRSTDALRKYAQADRANDQGEYQRAISLLKEAIAADSTFAMAYRKLGVILQNQSRGAGAEAAKPSFTRAYELRDRLTERERYLAEAAYAKYVQGDDQGSIDAYRSLLEKYPTDRIALNNIAINYGALDRQEEAVEYYLRSIALGGAPAVTYTNAIETLFYLDQRDSATAILERFALEYPEHPQVYRHQAALASAQFDYTTAEQQMRALRASQRGVPLFDALTGLELASYAVVRGQVDEGRRLLKDAYDVQAEHGLGFFTETWDVLNAEITAVLELRFRGDAAAAVRVLNDATRSAGWQTAKAGDRLDFATLYAEAGEVDRARTLLREYEALADSAERAQASARLDRHAVLGTIALAERRGSDAVAEFREARSAVPKCRLCALIDLGRAYDAAGEPDSAIVQYERYLDGPELFRAPQDNVNLWMVFRRLGALYEQRGDRERALEYYDRFVALWSDADAEFQPQLDDIRRRIASLAGERGE